MNKIERMFKHPRMFATTREAFVALICAELQHRGIEQARVNQFFRSCFPREGCGVTLEALQAVVTDEWALTVEREL